MTAKVDSINDKVKKVAGIGSAVANILPVPSAVKSAISAVQNVSAKVDKASSLVKKGIERGSALQAKAEKVGSVVGAAKLGKEVFKAGRAGYKTTRSFMVNEQKVKS